MTLSGAELARMAAEHVADETGCCAACSSGVSERDEGWTYPWPCDAAILLAHFVFLETGVIENAIADNRPPCAALRAENKVLREELDEQEAITASEVAHATAWRRDYHAAMDENKVLRERLAATNIRIGQLKEHSKGIVQGSSHLAIANAILAEHEPEMAALKSREKADDALCRACALASIIKQQAERLSLLFPTETQEANE